MRHTGAMLNSVADAFGAVGDAVGSLLGTSFTSDPVNQAARKDNQPGVAIQEHKGCAQWDANLHAEWGS